MKPTIGDTRWGESSGGVESTQVTDPAATPASGLRDTGYPDGAVPTAKIWTRLFNRGHKWFKYLDSVIDGSDGWTFPAAVNVVGALTTTTTALIGSTLGVVGGINLGANQSILLQGTGVVKHGSRTVSISASAGVGASSTVVGFGNNELRLSGGVGAVLWRVPLPVEPGMRILEVRCRVKDSTTGPSIIRSTLSVTSSDDTAGQIGSQQSSSGSGAYQTLTHANSAITVATGEIYHVKFDQPSGSNVNLAVLKIEMDYDRVS